jgi:hypothetical protein
LVQFEVPTEAFGGVELIITRGGGGSMVMLKACVATLVLSFICTVNVAVCSLVGVLEMMVDWTLWKLAMVSPDLLEGQFPAIPRTDDDLHPPKHLQAIANTAGFHFGSIEQGGSSLYPSLAQRVSSVEVLRILLSIGPTETMHFQTWQDKAGNAPPLTDPTNGLTFPDLNAPPFDTQNFQTNLIMPEPTIFLSRKFPPVSIIRPTETQGAATGAAHFLTNSGLFRGQPQEFFDLLFELAEAADSAQR